MVYGSVKHRPTGQRHADPVSWQGKTFEEGHMATRASLLTEVRACTGARMAELWTRESALIDDIESMVKRRATKEGDDCAASETHPSEVN